VWTRKTLLTRLLFLTESSLQGSTLKFSIRNFKVHLVGKKLFACAEGVCDEFEYQIK